MKPCALLTNTKVLNKSMSIFVNFMVVIFRGGQVSRFYAVGRICNAECSSFLVSSFLSQFLNLFEGVLCQ